MREKRANLRERGFFILFYILQLVTSVACCKTIWDLANDRAKVLEFGMSNAKISAFIIWQT